MILTKPFALQIIQHGGFVYGLCHLVINLFLNT